MNKLQLATVLSIVLASAACQGGGTAAPDAAAPAAAAPAEAAASPAGPADAPAAAPVPAAPATAGFDAAAVAAAGGLVKECSGARMALQCDASSKDCTSSTLQYIDPQGQARAAEKPRGMQDYTAVGLGCLTAKDGSGYFVVQYGELPYGCKFCEWFHLYDASGALLTHSDPPILTGADAAPDGQAPNNREFEAQHRKLGLGRPEVDLLGKPAG